MDKINCLKSPVLFHVSSKITDLLVQNSVFYSVNDNKKWNFAAKKDDFCEFCLYCKGFKKEYFNV